MTQVFNIQDDKVVITKLNLTYLEGAVIHAGTLDIVGNTSVQSNLNVNGTLTVDTLEVNNLITENGPQSDIGNWVSNEEGGLIGKGLSWTHGSSLTQFIYNTDNRLWTNSNLDLSTNHTYKIDGIDVIGYDFLGSQISKSNLTDLGILNSLNVSGDATIGQFAFFNEGLSRLGLNTEEPNGVLSVSENNVEFIIAAPNYGVATIGTYTNSDISVVTDNTPRFTVKNNGEVIFGNSITNSAVVTINGTLNVNTIVTDTRIDRSSPLQFNPSTNTPIYGLGLAWTGRPAPTQFILMPDPDRFLSTESIDIGSGKSYYINTNPVLSETALGPSVVNSSLTSLGPLSELLVSGTSTFGQSIDAQGGITANVIAISDTNGSINITSSNINTIKNISVSVNSDNVFYADTNSIQLGNNANTSRAINLYGKVGVGVTNVDSNSSLEINGNIRFANKRFLTGTTAPTQGSYLKGDICWNQNPVPGSYIGWVCIVDGAPGQWTSFGSIAQQ